MTAKFLFWMGNFYLIRSRRKAMAADRLKKKAGKFFQRMDGGLR